MFGAVKPLLDPESITELLPLHLGGRAEFHAHPTPLEHLQALQNATLMFMIAMVTVAVMVYGNKQTIKAYILASALTDFPHWGSFAYILGSEGLEKWRYWNAGLWTQLLVPVFTFFVKLGYLTGSFGPDKDVPDKTAKKRA